MISFDAYVKPFIDGNWLTIGIFLILMRSIARQFGVPLLRKIYLVLNNALEFIRPSSQGTPADTSNSKK